MATAADLKARLVLEAEARGAGEFEALASELEALAREGGAAAPKFEALAQSLRDVGAQDQLISDFAAMLRPSAQFTPNQCASRFQALRERSAAARALR